MVICFAYWNKITLIATTLASIPSLTFQPSRNDVGHLSYFSSSNVACPCKNTPMQLSQRGLQECANANAPPITITNILELASITLKLLIISAEEYHIPMDTCSRVRMFSFPEWNIFRLRRQWIRSSMHVMPQIRDWLLQCRELVWT